MSSKSDSILKDIVLWVTAALILFTIAYLLIKGVVTGTIDWSNLTSIMQEIEEVESMLI